MGPDFRYRALEVHSQYVWDHRWIGKMLDFMTRHDLNALILHRNDIVDRVVFPSALFQVTGSECANISARYSNVFRLLYKFTPTHRSGPITRSSYLNRIVEEASRLGIEVYLENKELCFPEILLEFHPELIKNGCICPSEPFWWDFLTQKYRELLMDVRGISGIITSPGTGESRVSISANRCSCDLCQNVDASEWYRSLLLAMYTPIRKAGKKLILRDFVFDSKTHRTLSQSIEDLPEDIVVSLKNTPHDFYPTFPDNPLIGTLGKRAQWIEFDTMGQYFGWGIGPSTMVDDLRCRLERARMKGAEGVMLRTDWENLDGHTSFHTPNVVNLIAGAAFSTDLSTDKLAIYRRYMEDNRFFAADVGQRDLDAAVTWVRQAFDINWEVVRRALFINGCVFSDSSAFPVSIDHALWLAEEKNSLKDWDPSKSNALSTDYENVQSILQEKDEALQMVEGLAAEVGGGQRGISGDFHKLLVQWYEIFRYYVRGFHAIGSAFILYRCLQDKSGKLDSEQRRSMKDRLQKSLADLSSLAEEYKLFYRKTSHAHSVYTLLNPDRLLVFREDVLSHLRALE
jgi:hypothetical protein